MLKKQQQQHQLHLFSLPNLFYTPQFLLSKIFKVPILPICLNWKPKPSIIWPNIIQL